MAVFVDDAKIRFGRMLMCHMVADTQAELKWMAIRIGVAERHYHRGHFNICQSMRSRAIAAGAIECTKREAAAKRRQLEQPRKERP